MAILPVNNVSFRGNYNQVNFEGKKKEKSYHGSTLRNVMRSIPLATLIAMSPMVGQAQAPQEKILSWIKLSDKQAVNPKTKNELSEMIFISTDGNDNDAEIVTLQSTSNTYRKGVKYAFTTYVDVKTLEVRNITNPENGRVTTEYYVWGPGRVARSRGETPEGEFVGEPYFPPKKPMKVEVTKDFYEYLVDLFKDTTDMVDYKTTNITEKPGEYDPTYGF